MLRRNGTSYLCRSSNAKFRDTYMYVHTYKKIPTVFLLRPNSSHALSGIVTRSGRGLYPVHSKVCMWLKKKISKCKKFLKTKIVLGNYVVHFVKKSRLPFSDCYCFASSFQVRNNGRGMKDPPLWRSLKNL